jgi:hypothetical protein
LLLLSTQLLTHDGTFVRSALAALSVHRGGSVTGFVGVFGADVVARRAIPGVRVMSVIWDIVFAVAWIVIAFWPARVAGRKGHSFLGYFVFSLFALGRAGVIGRAACSRGPVSASGNRKHDRS